MNCTMDNILCEEKKNNTKLIMIDFDAHFNVKNWTNINANSEMKSKRFAYTQHLKLIKQNIF